MKIQARSIIKPYSQVRRVLKTKAFVTLSANSITSIPITYNGILPDDRDFLFEPELSITYDLGYDGGVYAYVVDCSTSFVRAKNSTGTPVILPRHTRLGTAVEFAVNGCYQVSYKSAGLAICGWRLDRSERDSLRKASSPKDL